MIRMIDADAAIIDMPIRWRRFDAADAFRHDYAAALAAMLRLPVPLAYLHLIRHTLMLRHLCH